MSTSTPDLFGAASDLVSQGLSGFNQALSGASAAATQGAVQQAQGAIPGLISQASQAVQAELPAIASAGGQAVTQAIQTSLPVVQQAVAPAVHQAGHDFGQSVVQGAKEESAVPAAIVVTGATLLALVVGVAAWKGRKPEVRAAEQPFYRDPNPTREQRLPFVGMVVSEDHYGAWTSRREKAKTEAKAAATEQGKALAEQARLTRSAAQLRLWACSSAHKSDEAVRRGDEAEATKFAAAYMAAVG